ncbi:MAG: hypothetical protein SGARI_002656 [Bacillariaceae sp.]
MTLKDLGEVATRKILGDIASADGAAVTLSVKGAGGGMSLKLIEWNSEEEGQVLVRNVIPKMSVIQCAVQSGSIAKPNGPPEKRRKTTQEESDEALAKKIQEEEDMKSSSNKTPLATMENEQDPTQDMANMWIWAHGPLGNRTALGKWLLFYPSSTIFEKWKSIVNAVHHGELQQAVGAKVSTNLNRLQNPNAKGGSFVICVYTTKEQILGVGYSLIRLVQKDIHYKLDATTASGLYTGNGMGKVTETTLYWNRGVPSTTRMFWTKTESEKRARKANKQADKHTMILFDNARIMVRGLKFGYHKHSKRGQASFPMSVNFIREPSNKHDKNAVRVDCANGNSSDDSLCIGHVATEEAGILAPWLDRDLVKMKFSWR